MESNTNVEFLIKKFEGKESDWKDSMALTSEMQNEYQNTYTKHPKWTHAQIMCHIRMLVEITNYEDGNII